MFREPEDNITTFGWPWHGRVLMQGESPNFTYTVELPGGKTRQFPLFSAIEQRGRTTLFDKGRPDIPDPELAEQGGAWWGRAILRGELFTYADAGYVSDGSGSYESSELPGIPLWWEGDDLDQLPLFMSVMPSGNTLSFGWLIDGVAYNQYTSYTPAELDQTIGQPRCAVYSGSGLSWRELPANAGGSISLVMLGCYQNRILFGVVLTSSTGDLLTLPPSSGESSSASGPPLPYYGLVELRVDADVRDPDALHSQAFHMTVIENRSSALGHPLQTLSDVSNPEEETRSYSEVWVQTSGLLTAWYDPNGVIRSARYSREQKATLEHAGDGLNYHWDTSRSTKLKLHYSGGGVVDERELTEQLTITALDGHLDIVRRVTATDAEDDVSEYHDSQYAQTYNLEPDKTFLPGLHLVMGAVAYVVPVNWQNNVLELQDIHQLWLVAHGNNVASICSSREPYDYAEGAASMNVQVYSGRAVGPLGPVGGPMTATINRPKTSLPSRYYRGLLSEFGAPWLRGAGNPATGEIARAGDYISSGATAITWI